MHFKRKFQKQEIMKCMQIIQKKKRNKNKKE